MTIIQYENSQNLTVKFNDIYEYKKKTSLDGFRKGTVLNPYFPTVCNIGIKGAKYKISEHRKKTKEYATWHGIIERCSLLRNVDRQRKYQYCDICKEWLLYENFYEWLHDQENFNKWINGGYSVDKDILFKNNTIYSPKRCCLVPDYVNSMFIKADIKRKNKIMDTPIGVTYRYRNSSHVYEANCSDPLKGKTIYLGSYNDELNAFASYKAYKERLIKQVANIEFNNHNITEQCYKAMINYQVEFTD